MAKLKAGSGAAWGVATTATQRAAVVESSVSRSARGNADGRSACFLQMQVEQCRSHASFTQHRMAPPLSSSQHDAIDSVVAHEAHADKPLSANGENSPIRARMRARPRFTCLILRDSPGSGSGSGSGNCRHANRAMRLNRLRTARFAFALFRILHREAGLTRSRGSCPRSP